MSVSEIYQQELKARSFHSDPAQLQAVAALDDCAKAWAGYKRKRANAIKKLINHPDIPQGVYLYGGVGRGKSFLMDCFYQAVPIERKTRLHFHEFMREVHRELRDLQRRLGLTTIFVTHDQEEANTICDRIAVMKDGVIQQVGTPMELYEHPANLFVAGFLGTANILEGKIKREGEAASFELTDGTRVTLQNAATAAEGARLVFRPQYAAIGLRGFATGGVVALPGTIVHREFLGATVRYAVKLGAQEALVDAPFRSGGELLEIGADVDVAIAPERLQFLAG